MRTLAIFMVVLAVALVVPAYCAETKAVTPVKGVVTKITPVGEACEISVKGDVGTETICKLYKETKVTKGGKVVSVEDILVTDTVTVTKAGDAVESVEIDVIPETVPVTTKSGAPVTTRTGEPVVSKSAEEQKM